MGHIFSCCAHPGQSSPSSTSLRDHCASSWKTLEIPSPKKDAEKITLPSPPTHDLLSSSSSQGTGQTRHRRTETTTPPPIPRQAGVDTQGSLHHTAITAMMHCLDVFIRCCCYCVVDLKPGDVTSWCHNKDHLLLQGWQKLTFMTPANIVIIYMLCGEAIGEGVETIDDLRATFYTCLYIAYAYLGWEISYPVQPFIMEHNRCPFWKLCLSFTLHFSTALLKINNDELFFMRVFQELKHEGDYGAIYHRLPEYWGKPQNLYIPSVPATHEAPSVPSTPEAPSMSTTPQAPSMPATPEASYDDDPLGLRNFTVFDADDGLRLAPMGEVEYQEGPGYQGAYAPEFGYYLPGFGCFPDLMEN
uniref:Uncharacterized protein n=1 Tax=Leptobrachium leishanense TaxID=445787 RepID=A0A8C5PU62_9ANUR